MVECPFVPVSSRISFLYAEYGYLEMDGHTVVLRQGEQHVHLPVGATTAVLVEPGTVVTHAAVKACAESGCLLLWVGENGVRLYASGNPGRDASALLRQAGSYLDDKKRLHVARSLFNKMFSEEAPQGRSIEQLRGIEGSRVKTLYTQMAKDAGIEWRGRNRDVALVDPVNRAISGANAALYGLTECVILALGYSPAIGFVHHGDPRSFVFDLADCVKFQTVVPLAFQVAKESPSDIDGRIRRACRDEFCRAHMADRLVDILEDLFRDGLASDD